MKKCHTYPILLMLFVTLLTNAFASGFNSEVFVHEIEHEHHVLSIDPTAHLEAHQNLLDDDGHLDAATHLGLHAAGQYQPFFFTTPPLVPASISTEVPTTFLPVAIPESIPDSPLRPPRISFAS